MCVLDVRPARRLTLKRSVLRVKHSALLRHSRLKPNSINHTGIGIPAPLSTTTSRIVFSHLLNRCALVCGYRSRHLFRHPCNGMPYYIAYVAHGSVESRARLVLVCRYSKVVYTEADCDPLSGTFCYTATGSQSTRCQQAPVLQIAANMKLRAPTRGGKAPYHDYGLRLLHLFVSAKPNGYQAAARQPRKPADHPGKASWGPKENGHYEDMGIV